MEWFLTSASASQLLPALELDAEGEENGGTPLSSDGIQLGATVDSLLSAEKEQQQVGMFIMKGYISGLCP